MSNKVAIPVIAALALLLVVFFNRRPGEVATMPPPAAAPILSGWTQRGANAPQALCEAQGAAFGGVFYVIGGYYTPTPTYRASVEVNSFDPVTGVWTRHADLPRGMTHAGVAIGATKIFLCGGYPLLTTGYQAFACTDVNEFDPVANKWTALPPLPAARGAGAACLDGSVLHYMAGVNISRVDQTSHWTIDLSQPKPSWKTSVSMPSGRNHVPALMLNKKIYVVGGQQGTNDSNATNTMFIFDILKGTWSSGPKLPVPLSHHADSTFVMNGQIIVAGGITTGAIPQANIYGFDPASNRWYSITPGLPHPRHSPVVHFANGYMICTTGYYWPPGFQDTTYTCTYTLK